MKKMMNLPSVAVAIALAFFLASPVVFANPDDCVPDAAGSCGGPADPGNPGSAGPSVNGTINGTVNGTVKGTVNGTVKGANYLNNYSPSSASAYIYSPTSANATGIGIGEGGDAKAAGIGIGEGGSAKQKASVTSKIIITDNEKHQRNPVNSAISPGLTAGSGDQNCAGSNTGALQLPGVALSGGGTTEQKGCERRRDANMWKLWGEDTVAIARMCQDSKNADAYRAAGKTCPQDKVKPTGGAVTKLPVSVNDGNGMPLAQNNDVPAGYCEQFGNADDYRCS
ncbi:hypothetical protein ACFL22_00440 [Patescibacteria group bacterium]